MYMSGSLINFDRFNDTEEIQKQALDSASKGGPNSGFEIEGIDFFKNPELANEFPEMKDDIDLIVSTESYIARLVDFRRRVHQNKGMSRGMAHELLELVPSLESHTSPMHFTEDLSGIGVESSLEAIDVKLWAIIGAAIAFVVGLIYKFIKWLGFGAGNETASLDEVKKGIKEADSQVVKQEKAIHETSKILSQVGNEQIEVPIPDKTKIPDVEQSDIPDPLKKEIIKASSRLGSALGTELETKPRVKVKLRDVLDDLEGGPAIYNYIREPNKWARIIYSGIRNPVLDTVINAFEAFESGSGILVANLQYMEEIIGHLEQLDDARMQPGTKMEQLGLASKVHAGMATVQSALLDKGEFKVAGKSYESISQWAVAVKTVTTQDIDKIGGPFDNMEDMISAHEVAMRRLGRVKFIHILTFIEALQKAEPILKRFDRIAKSEASREHMGVSDTDAPRAELAKQMMSVANRLSRDFNGLMMVFGIISKIYEEASKHGTMIVDKMRSNARKIVAYYNKYGEQPPPTLEELVYRLDEEAENMRQAEIQSRMLPASAMISLRDHPGSVRVTIGDDDSNSMTMSFDDAAKALRAVTGDGKDKK